MAWTSEFETILRGHLPLAADVPLSPTVELRDLGLDSMELVSLLLDLEEGFAITVPDELLVGPTFATAQTLWDAISSLVESGNQVKLA